MKKWRVMPFDREAARQLAAETGVPPLVAVLLQTRGVAGVEQVRELLSDEYVFSDPFLLPDMDKAVERIARALDGFEKIAVYGDYDADGVTATAMMYSYLESSGGSVMYYIPDRESEGYGLNMKAVDTLHGQGVQLILTVDNGVSSVAEVEYAASLGIDTVITDHHRPRDVLPPAAAVVDAWRADCGCPFRDYSGAGVAFKLLTALEGPELGPEALLENYADLAAIGTIGDVVPLTGENRLLVKAGLAAMSQTDRPGLEALLEAAGLDRRPLTASDVAFVLVPRINATGRMGSSGRAVSLLTTESPEEAGGLAAEICEENAARRRTEDEVLRQAMQKLERDPSLRFDRVLVVSGDEWHHGVIGIVAARITERFGKPCVVVSCSGDEAKGSGRSVEGFSLFDAVCSCGDLLTKFGGHPMAAGMSLPAANVPELRRRLNVFAASLPGPMPSPVLRIDCALKPGKLSTDIPKSLEMLEPFGTGNPFPLFALEGVTVTDVSPVGGGKHLRITVKKDGSAVQCMKFGTTLEAFPCSPGDTVDLAVVLESRPYNGRDSLSVVIRDVHFTGVDEDALIGGRALYEKFRRGEPLTEEETGELVPAHGDFAAVYRALRDGGCRGSEEDLFGRMPEGDRGFARLLTALSVLTERGLAVREPCGDTYQIRAVHREGKVRLEDSPLLARLYHSGKAGEQKNGIATQNI